MRTDEEIWKEQNNTCHSEVDMESAIFTLQTLQLEVLLNIRKLMEEKK